MLLTIINRSIGITSNIHNHNTSFHNLQPTVRHIEGDIEVGIVIDELVCGKIHIIYTCQSTRSGSITCEANAGGIVCGISSAYRIA